MNTPDISNLSLPELKDLKIAVARMIETREAEAANEARAQIAEIAKSVGIPLKDLIKIKGSTVAVKYRDPADKKNEWTGRGRMPGWAEKMHKAGTLETARV